MENEQQSTAEPEGGGAEDQQAPPLPPRPSHPRLAKRRDAGWFTGVAAGVGAYFNVDPIWVRLTFVVSTMFGGLGVVLYLVAIFVLSDATQSEVEARPLRSRAYNEAWTTREWYFGSGRVFLLVIVIALALSISSAWNFGGFSFLLAVLLAAGGMYFLADADRSSAVAERIFGTTMPPPDATTTAYETPQGFRPPVDPEIARQREEQLAKRRAARRDRRVLESVTFGAMLVVVGVLAALDRTDTHDFAVSTMIASALLTLGIGIVVGAFRGRSFLLILLAFLLTPFVIASSAINGSVRDGVGEREWHLDLRDIKLADGETRNVTVHLTTGRIDVRLPAGVGYDVTANVDYGHLDVMNGESETTGPKRSTQRSAPGTGLLVIDAELHNGAIFIDQEGRS
jgi:phage shock protein PspC (stress-responsive transcriptional regulator)